MNVLNVLLQAGGGGAMSSIIMLVAIIVIFYFFMIRPQQKRQKEEKKFREALTKGQRVVTIGGLHGKIADVRETTVLIEVANDVKIEVEKTAVAMSVATDQKN
ncbi:MAG: preprotein translocase subunit YajC [Candidatus Onthomorpha sp.]|nr:preprotein translocase subunit YajC [Bacteroidales bacterium]MDY3977069.1 preprotein translocase subunit YajC [Candidatus Onthomorpha sp.]MCI5715994.1 preprotein translocase subunit YajC [Bacteroidales bacterium]MCI6416430.1 preprotein translocase subunit YajC [Bacteroidales bacterium]MCI6644474.1 preprotein translocase subunit YajC [Bacteroidales bacterium]